MDNFSSYADLVDPRGQVTLMEYPPNCINKHQLIVDQGISQASKVRYRTKLLPIRVDTKRAAAKLCEQVELLKMTRGTLGLAEEHELHMLDAIELGVAA